MLVYTYHECFYYFGWNKLLMDFIPNVYAEKSTVGLLMGRLRLKYELYLPASLFTVFLD